MKSVELAPLYYKQGTDMAGHLEKASVADALEAFAAQLAAAAKDLRRVKRIVAGHRVKIDADTHHIGITGPDEVIDKLVAAGLAEVDDEDEDSEEEE